MTSLLKNNDKKNLDNILYSATVSIDGLSIIARDGDSNVISSGVAGTDDSRVITEAISSVPDEGNVFISSTCTNSENK